MSAYTRLRAAAASGQLRADILATMDGLDLPEPVRARIEAYCERRTAGLMNLSETIKSPDEDDFYRSLAALWLELRFEWQRHNLVSNYIAVRTGGCDLGSFVLAAASSGVLRFIEEHLDPTDREIMDEFAAELIGGTHHTLRARLDSVPNDHVE